MARKIIYTCDRCGKEYTDKDILPYGYPMWSIKLEYKDYNSNHELCIDCQQQLKEWFINR